MTTNITTTNPHINMEFNTKKKKLTVWLAKVPKYLGEQIINQRRGTTIGNIEVEKTSDEIPSLKIRFSNMILNNGSIPKEHIIEIKDKPNTMYLVSHSGNMSNSNINSNINTNINSNMNVSRSNNKSTNTSKPTTNNNKTNATNNNKTTNKSTFEVEGLINKECFVRPVINAEYLQFKRKQKNQQESTEEKVKVIDYFSEVKRSAKYSALKEMDLLARKRKLMLQGKKRERLEKSDVMEIVFNAFEKHSFWTVKDLADFSGQPIAYIQEIVNEICVMNKKDHKNTYELKPEYKQ